MKKKILIVSISLFLITNCNVRKNVSISEPKFSIENCLEQNLKDSTLMTGWYYVADSGFVRQWAKTDDVYYINPRPIITAEDIIKLEIKENRWHELIFMQFGKRGTATWQEATKEAIGNNLAFIVNDTLLATPMVHNQITNGISIFSRIDYSKSEMEEIIKAIEKNKSDMIKPL